MGPDLLPVRDLQATPHPSLWNECHFLRFTSDLSIGARICSNDELIFHLYVLWHTLGLRADGPPAWTSELSVALPEVGRWGRPEVTLLRVPRSAPTPVKRLQNTHAIPTTLWQANSAMAVGRQFPGGISFTGVTSRTFTLQMMTAWGTMDPEAWFWAQLSIYFNAQRLALLRPTDSPWQGSKEKSQGLGACTLTLFPPSRQAASA